MSVGLDVLTASAVEDFAGYNNSRSKDLHSTLVGNWVEERQLEHDTGVFRYKKWVEEGVPKNAPDGDAELSSRTTIARPSPMKTSERTIVHSERMESHNWHARTSEAHPVPGEGTAFPQPVDLPNALGPRQAALMQQMLMEASLEPPASVNDHATGSYAEAGVKSVAQLDFTGTAPSSEQFVKPGARVMYSQDGIAVDPVKNDASFAVEILRKPKGQVDARRLERGWMNENEKSHSENAHPLGRGHSVYSQLHDFGAYPTYDVFGTTVGGVNPFGKNSGFSMPVSDSRKREEE